MLALNLAAVAMLASQLLGLPSVLFGLVAGMAAARFGGAAALHPGAAVAARSVLRFGVAILGSQITLGQTVALGPAPALVAVGAPAVTLLGGLLIARWLRLPTDFSILTRGRWRCAALRRRWRFRQSFRGGQRPIARLRSPWRASP